MNAIQLEFNVENECYTDLKVSLMQRQLIAMEDSVGKVRRKLFAEMGEIKKMYGEMKIENEKLKDALRLLNDEKTEWDYGQDGYLFDVCERAKTGH